MTTVAYAPGKFFKTSDNEIEIWQIEIKAKRNKYVRKKEKNMHSV